MKESKGSRVFKFSREGRIFTLQDEFLTIQVPFFTSQELLLVRMNNFYNAKYRGSFVNSNFLSSSRSCGRTIWRALNLRGYPGAQNKEGIIVTSLYNRENTHRNRVERNAKGDEEG